GATAQHALEHALSALRPDLPHAAGLVLLCRAFFRRLAEKAPDRFLELSLALGCPELEAGPEGFHRALDRLLAEVGLGELKARDFGLDPSMAGLLADNALATNERLIGLTPGGMDRADLVQILEEALA
ncbi:MAG TPA: alcohol dehydrogenase, partial [Desulfovibrio sp.]|nr:alcohol dehydrogenase [Desulfovibrio sp.]